MAHPTSNGEAEPPEILLRDFFDPISPSQAWDAAPRGQRFVMLQPDTREAVARTNVNIVFGWAEEVRRLTATSK